MFITFDLEKKNKLDTTEIATINFNKNHAPTYRPNLAKHEQNTRLSPCCNHRMRAICPASADNKFVT